MTPAQVPQALDRLGWHGVPTAAAVAEFQRGWALGPALLIDGKAGPKTRAALAQSIARLDKHQPTASPSFSYAEFACACRGTERGCARIKVHRQLLLDLERYRATVGGPVRIVSGYRCPRHNVKAGGAENSQHLYGAAADLDYRLSWQTVARLRLFAGIGRRRSTGKVRHVDVRHVSGHNTTGGTPDRPTIWDYAS